MDQRRPDLPTGTVTFLFSDIEGSTRLARELGPGAYRAVLEEHNRLLRTAFAAHGGVERGTQGDAFLVIFRDASEAIGAALDAQRAVATASWPVGVIVRVRMGIHSGAGILGGDDYVGLDVNRAARIAAAAHGGQVLLSDATRALVEQDLPAGSGLRDLGNHMLKDLARPERLSQLMGEGLQSEFPELATTGHRPNNLPLRLTSFVGRERELEEVGHLLASNRLVTITGPGGTGKSSLAVELARRSIERFPDGAWFVPLEGLTDPGLIPAAVASALRLLAVDRRTPAERVMDYLVDRQLLLVLDNFEHLAPGADFVRGLLEGAPGVEVLVASQVSLHLGGEQEYPLGTLSTPAPLGAGSGAEGSGAEAILASPAVQLFVDRARSVRPSFALDASNREAVAAVCSRLDGLPLTIELAAANVRLQSPAAILERLSKRIELLATQRTDVPERQRSVSGAVAWSYELLGDTERCLLRRMSVFAGGAGLAEIEALVADVAEVPDAFAALAGLVDRSLVQPIADADDRYGMLETIRSFAAARLREQGEDAAATRRHAELYMEIAERAEPELVRSSRRIWLDRLTVEHDNLRAALDRMEAAGELEIALRMSAALWRFWQLTGHLTEARLRIERLLALAEPFASTFSPVLMSRAEEAAGGIGYWLRQGDLPEIRRHYERSLEYAVVAGDEQRTAWATYNLSFVYDYVPAAVANMQPDRDRANDLRAEALRRFRDVGDRRGIAYTLWAMGGSPVAIADEPDVLRERLRESLVLFRETEEAYGETWALMSLAMVEAVAGRMAEALDAIREGAALFRRDGDLSGQIVILDQLAALAARGGDNRLAVRLEATGQAARRETGVRVPPIPPLRGPIEAARLGLDPAEIAREEAIGSAMSLEEALESAVIGSEAPGAVLRTVAEAARHPAAVDPSPDAAR